MNAVEPTATGRRPPEFERIREWIQPGARILDLGCGDGTLLAYLAETRGTTGYGLEISDANILSCVRKGVNVLQTDLDRGLGDFDADSFDVVIMSQTLQAIRRPDRLVEEMLRVGRQGIVTFPNFAYWRLRLHLALLGRMPVSDVLPHNWYDTPNIHLFTLHDFEALCRERGIRILERDVTARQHRSGLGQRLLPNLLGAVALYRFERERRR